MAQVTLADLPCMAAEDVIKYIEGRKFGLNQSSKLCRAKELLGLSWAGGQECDEDLDCEVLTFDPVGYKCLEEDCSNLTVTVCPGQLIFQDLAGEECGDPKIEILQ